jgi:2-amino-4-hydroxy-6-hydroxymethyldihydropteridine diphosphokinase
VSDRTAAPADAAPSGAGQHRRVVLALGSNLGDRLRSLQGAVDALFDAPGLTFVAVSPVYETEPVGGPAQPDYLNAVLLAGTTLPAREILALTSRIEQAFHRVREIPMGPRTLDIDIITCGGEVSDDPVLTLPHPCAHERAFVLAPWLDADPAAAIPGRGRVADLLAGLTSARARRLRDVVLRAPE